MCALGRESWVQTPLPPICYQTLSSHNSDFLRNAPSKGHHSRYIKLFFEDTYSVISFYELMGICLVGLMHFLRLGQ